MRDTKCGSCQEFCIHSPDTVGHGRDGQLQVRAGAGLWATSYCFLSGLALYSNTVTKGTGHSELIGGTLHIPTFPFQSPKPNHPSVQIPTSYSHCKLLFGYFIP